ncbi:hypothetical protein AB6A40_008498 [Gnathostoma spinigerum]|uniref:Transmembrane protein 98 n=1 Tax=Gnathostoma spinigerum TaxID=75299 RepID=A0ABD6EUC5_9BILA
MLEHCVSILKLCHTLTENLSSVSLNSVNPQLNKAMLTATHRIMPQFDDVIRAMATAQVDLRLLEARLSSLVTACWALTVPFLLACPKSAGNLGSIQKNIDVNSEYRGRKFT